MNPTTEDIKDYLEGNSSLVLGTDLFIGSLPETSPDMAIVLIDTSGMAPERHGIRIPSMQIMCRGNEPGDYKEAYAKLEVACNLIHELTNITINSTRYIQILKISDLMYVGKDKKRRNMFSCNFLIKRT